MHRVGINTMLSKKICLRAFVLTLLLLSSSSFIVAERHERLIDEWRPVHYDVSLTLNHRLTEVSTARTEITAQITKPLVTSIKIDFGEMPIDSVSVDGKPAKYERGSGTLTVALSRAAKKDDLLRIAIAYHGHPKDGLILANDKDGRPSATGDNWPDRVHNWIPSLDHPSAKASVRFTVTAPTRELVVANGKLETTRTNSNKTRTWVWNERIPISPYCMIVAVGEFAHLEAQDQSISSLSYYVPQSDRLFAMQGFAPSAPSLKYFSATIATYPYEKLAMIVGATRYGGMENSSAIVFGRDLFKDFKSKTPRSRIYDIPNSLRNTVSHEIAHQWFGDSVTEATWADLWLSEGFATYFEGLFIEHFEGEAEFQSYMKWISETYFTYEKKYKTPIHDTETEDLNELLNPNNYDKGAWVLHMLRGLTGDKAFFAGLRDYYASHRNATATSEDLRSALEKRSRLDLKDFFTQWVYGSGHPHYEATWKFDPHGDSNEQGFVEVEIHQIQDGNEVFQIPITVEIVTSSETRRVTIKPIGRVATARVPVTSVPIAVKIDPDNIILKELNVKQVD